jgi:hypothetical protein
VRGPNLANGCNHGLYFRNQSSLNSSPSACGFAGANRCIATPTADLDLVANLGTQK